MSSKKDKSNPWNERRLARGTARESETPVLHPHHENELPGHFYFFFPYYLNIHTREQEEWQVLRFLNTVCISFKHLCSFCICSIFKLINDDKCEYVLCLSFPECWNDD